MTIAVDFDGTIVEHAYPKIGKEKPFAIDALIQLKKEGHHVILWTIREGRYLEDAVEFCRNRGLEFYAVNSEYPQNGWDANSPISRKIKADIYIDDRNVGGIPDWGEIYAALSKNGAHHHRRRKKNFFARLMGRCFDAREKYRR